MRTAGDERGGGPPERRPEAAGPMDDMDDTAAATTRVFTRGTERDGPGEDTHHVDTADLPPEPAGPLTEDPADPSAEPTRTFTRPDPERRRAPGSRDGGSVPRRRPRRRWLRPGRIIALLLLVAVALPVGTWGWVWYVARQDDRPPSDAIVVMGASQYNGRPSPIFEARLRHAQELFNEGVAPMIVTVGGNQPGDNYTEGGSGRDWLVEHGVPADQVVAIREGRDTLQSMEAISTVFDGHGWSSSVIVTDPWHSLRSRIMAEDHGMAAATSPVRSGPAVVERETQLWYITRETMSLWYYWIFGNSSQIDLDAT